MRTAPAALVALRAVRARRYSQPPSGCTGNEAAYLQHAELSGVEVYYEPEKTYDPGSEQLVKREYAVLYLPIEDGWIMATVPDLPGAVTQGKTIDEARAMIKEAVELLLQSYRENAAKDAPGNSIWETISVDLPAA
jgi:predicted RNase H-like HicB family nuclease